MEILNYDQEPAGGFAIAKFDIYMKDWRGLLLRRYRVCRSKKGHLFVSAPSYKKGEGADGKAQWESYSAFNDPQEEKSFNASVLEALKPFVA